MGNATAKGGRTKGLRARLLEYEAVNRLSEADPSVARDHYQSVIDSVASVICTVDRDLRITGVNRRWDTFARLIYGDQYTSEHILGTHLFSLMDRTRVKGWQEVCPQILDGEVPLYVDEVVRDGQAAWRNYTVVASPLRDTKGEIVGITLVMTDITKLKMAEAEMLKRLIEIQGLRHLAQVAGTWFDRRAFHKKVTGDMAHFFDAEKCIIFRWGESSGHLEAQAPAYGLTGPELADLALDIGDPAEDDSLWRDLEERDYILLNEGDEAPDSMVEASARVDKLAAMIAVLRVSGRVHGTILIAGRSRPFTDQDGQLAATFAVPIVLAIEDAELSQRLRDRVRQLAASREELQRVTHTAESIRVPLTVVRGYLELLLDGALGPLGDRQAATVGMVLGKTQEIADVINRLLPTQFVPDSSRYEAVHLVALVRRVQERWLGAARLAGLDLAAELPTVDSAEYVTAGDPDLLFGVFDGLLDNAVKFSPNGGTIRMSVHKSNEIVYVKIDDPGTGIPTHQMPLIWQPKESKSARGPIGLAEVKRIVEQHGGQVWVESALHRGSSFYVMLPKAVDEQ